MFLFFLFFISFFLFFISIILFFFLFIFFFFSGTKLNKPTAGQRHGYGFVDMDNHASALEAVEALHQKYLVEEIDHVEKPKEDAAAAPAEDVAAEDPASPASPEDAAAAPAEDPAAAAVAPAVDDAAAAPASPAEAAAAAAHFHDRGEQRRESKQQR